MTTMQEKVQEAFDFLASKMVTPPLIGMILGTGLGRITKKMDVSVRVPYEEIPHFPVSTIEGHQGTLVCGTLGNKPEDSRRECFCEAGISPGKRDIRDLRR
jgi:purine-nucleoside phosphorylase